MAWHDADSGGGYRTLKKRTTRNAAGRRLCFLFHFYTFQVSIDALP
jgi:hypothetical protein